MKQKIFKFPRVGIGVLIFKKNKILLGKRKGSHGTGEYASPGGHLEYMETIEDCAKRETFEETGIKIKNIRFQFAANIRKYKPKHYLHVGVTADYKSGKVKIKEREKIESWDWYNLNKLPKPLFLMAKMAIEAYKKKKIYFSERN
jgi:8-oxo-dGTP diphosphatase